jgi:glycosyltransferase involved in cell wall biosynthesis
MYNEQSVVPLLRAALEEFLREIPCQAEVILVNDGSYDSTLEQIVQWAGRGPSFKKGRPPFP